MAEIPFDPDEIMNAIELAVVDDVIEIGELMAQALVFTTPVGMPELWQSAPPADYTPGHARFNWRVGLNETITEEREGVDPAGGSTVEEMRLVIRQMDSADDQLNFTLTIPYGFRLDNGWSDQRPEGFTERAILAARTAAGQNRAPL